MRMYPNFKQFADKDVTITHTEAGHGATCGGCGMVQRNLSQSPTEESSPAMLLHTSAGASGALGPGSV